MRAGDYKAADAPWYIVVTKPSSEEMAERSLRELGYRVALVRYRKMLRGHHLPGWRASAPLSMRPAFRGYVFIQDWHGWPRPIETISGVERLMTGAAGRPQTLSNADIELIRRAEHSGDFDECPPHRGRQRRDDLTLGDTVELMFSGERVLGVLSELSDNGKAIVQAMMFNREIPLTVKAEDLELVVQ